MAKIEKKFITFLREKGMLQEYIIGIREHHFSSFGRRKIHEISDDVNSVNQFQWGLSESGSGKWNLIDNEWIRLHNANNNN